MAKLPLEMSTPDEQGRSSRDPATDRATDPSTDPSRRTWLAAERTWLAWWRTGLGSAAVAIGVGRLLPNLAGGAKWPYRLLGIGYAALAVAVLAIGAERQRRVAAALRRGGYEELSTPLVMWLTAAASLLAAITLVLVVVNP
jgi:putative membrane protein